MYVLLEYFECCTPKKRSYVLFSRKEFNILSLLTIFSNLHLIASYNDGVTIPVLMKHKYCFWCPPVRFGNEVQVSAEKLSYLTTMNVGLKVNLAIVALFFSKSFFAPL